MRVILSISASLAALVNLAPAMAQTSPPMPEPVGMILNGMPMPEPGLLIVRGSSLLTRLEDLRQLGIDALKAPNILHLDGQDFVELETIPGLSAELDESKENLKISASPDVFPHLAFGAPASRPPLSPILPAEFLGYDLALSNWGGKMRLSGLLDAGISGKWGVLGSTALLTGQGLRTVRLDTAYRRDFPEKRLRLILGDTVSRPGPGGQSLRFGGIQFGTDFSLDPQSLNFPLPVIAGSATLPSTVELLSEAQRQSYQVAPGAFDIALQPRLTGAGQVTMSIRDLTGNTREIVRNFYTSTDLLRPGLADYSFEAGALRQDYGSASNRYGSLFLAAGLRRPFASWLTGQARMETAAGVSVLSVGANFVVGPLADVSVTGAGSYAHGRKGRFARMQVRRTTPTYSLSASYQSASQDFQEVGQGDFRAGARRELAVSGSLALGQFGGLNLAHAQLQDHIGTPDERSFSISSVSYSLGIFGGFLNAGIQRATHEEARGNPAEWSVFASYTMALGPRRNASLFAEKGRTAGTFDIALPDGPGWGLRALAGKDRGDPWLEASVAARTPAGDISMAASRRGSASGVQLTAQGAVVRVGKTALATPRLDNAFALVDVAGDEAVDVTVENRPFARRAGGGRKVIATGLQPYAANRIGIDASDLAMDVALLAADTTVTSGWRQAAYVHFGDSARNASAFRLVDPAGEPVPVGAAVLLPQGTGVVGHDGEVWLEDFAPGSFMIVAYHGRQCRAVLPTETPATKIGRTHGVTCRPYIQMEDVP